VSGLRPDDDEIGIELGRDEDLLLVVSRPQSERGIMVEIDTLALGEAELTQGHGELDS
jgi:hypothetical protein